MKLEKNYIIGAVIIVVIILVVYMTSGDYEQKEKYISGGRIQNIGPVEEDEIIEIIKDDIIESQMPSQQNYAKLVDMVEDDVLITSNDNDIMQRLAKLQDSYKVPEASLPYSYDVAQPLSHYTSSTAPRVFLKGRLHDMNLATAVRGNLKIKNHDVKRWQNKYGPEDSGGTESGLYESTGGDLLSKLNRVQQLNKPMYLSGSGNTGGVGGNTVDLIME